MNKIETDNGFVTSIDGEPYEVPKSHDHYETLLEAVEEDDPDKFFDHYKTRNKIQADFEGTDLEIDDGQMYYKGRKIEHGLADKIIRLVNNPDEDDPSQLVHFLDRLMENPSASSVEELYRFLKHNSIPITDKGYILAWKAVRKDFKDVYSGEFDNSPGRVHEMPRNQVDDRREKACSEGFHVGAWDYAGPEGTYGPSDKRVVQVKVDPKDVVSVPKDHDDKKCRVCRYEVVQEVSGGDVETDDTIKEDPSAGEEDDSEKDEDLSPFGVGVPDPDRAQDQPEDVRSDDDQVDDPDPTLSDDDTEDDGPTTRW